MKKRCIGCIFRSDCTVFVRKRRHRLTAVFCFPSCRRSCFLPLPTDMRGCIRCCMPVPQAAFSGLYTRSWPGGIRVFSALFPCARSTRLIISPFFTGWCFRNIKPALCRRLIEPFTHVLFFSLSSSPAFSKAKNKRLKPTATREASTIPLNSISPKRTVSPLKPVVKTTEVKIKFLDLE